MSTFRTKDLGDRITRIEGPGAVGMYLIEGDTKAVLLDTGVGILDINEFVHTLTDKPIEVYMTHGHLDHAGGMYRFDEVHMSHKDLELASTNTKAARLDYGEILKKFFMDGDWTEDDVCDQREIRVIDIADDEVIDLGGRTLTVVPMPGHTAGSVAFLDSISGKLFVGDACNNSTFMFPEESTSLEVYLETLRRFKKDWDDKVTDIVICHDYDVVPRDLIDNLIECCEEILAGTDDKEPFVHPNPIFANQPVRWAKRGGPDRKDGKLGNIAYRY